MSSGSEEGETSPHLELVVVAKGTRAANGVARRGAIGSGVEERPALRTGAEVGQENT